MAVPARILDIDGTLIDSSYRHALAWHRALRRTGLLVQPLRIDRHIGMGDDQIVSAPIGEEADSRCGESIRQSYAENYEEMIDEVEPVEGARELIEHLDAGAWAVVLASSVKAADVNHCLELPDAHTLVDSWISSTDLERRESAPDMGAAAMETIGAPTAVMVGDSISDVEAAGTAGIPAIAVLSGGFSAEELRRSGAAELVESVEDVAGALNRQAEALHPRAGPRAATRKRPQSRSSAIASSRLEWVGIEASSPVMSSRR